jgi:YD repeat-containing protein
LRDQRRNLVEIRTPHGRAIKFQYDEQSRIIRAQDDQGKWSEYRYDGEGMLTDVVSSSGHRRQYSYDGLLMTVIEDENQNVLLRNYYEYGRLTRQDFGNGRVYSYVYSPSSGAYAETVTVTLPDATQMNIETAQSVPSYVKDPPH